MNKELEYILSAAAVRDRTKKLYDLTLEDKTSFKVNIDKIDEVTSYVLEVIKDNYPTLEIPFHSRWGHFQVGDVDRNSKLNQKIANVDPIERARIKLDLVITSVLLDAGAGPAWSFDEDGEIFTRSEGLGVASWHMFMNRAFSSDETLKADAKALTSITPEQIEKAFQVTPKNPLVAAEGRANLLKSLGECVASKPEVFKDARPGNIIDHMIEKFGMKFAATDLLEAVLINFGDIWPSRLKKDGINLGDVWHHPLLGDADSLESLVPFHKLSQWLTYSLIEPIEEAGVNVHSASNMTGLAEYRNGGLLIDTGLIELKDKSLMDVAHKPNSEVIIEWRALTVSLLDIIGDKVRAQLNFTADEFPLAKVLEGGTWWAGRKIAATLRKDMSPPLKLDSDGTVF
jgi:hypothetical protein